MDDEPSKLQEEACGARPQGPHATESMHREPAWKRGRRKLGSRLAMKYFAMRDGTACWFVA